MKTDADEKGLPEGLPYQTMIASLLHRVLDRAAQRDLRVSSLQLVIFVWLRIGGAARI